MLHILIILFFFHLFTSGNGGFQFLTFQSVLVTYCHSVLRCQAVTQICSCWLKETEKERETKSVRQSEYLYWGTKLNGLS